jgi:HK97 family phage major capsid protein
LANKKPDPKEEGTQQSYSIDSLRGKTPEQLKQIIDTLDVHLKALHQEEDGSLRSLDEDEQKAFDSGMAIREEGMRMLEEHQRVALVFQKNPTAVEGIFNIVKGQVDDRDLDVRRMSRYEISEAAAKKLESRQARRLAPGQLDQLADRMESEPNIAARLLLTENEAYRSAWQKAVTQASPLYTDEERDALLRFRDFERAGAESPTSAGGFGIPVFIDPHIILTAQGSGNPFLELARQVTVNTNVWKGVSSAGVSWAFQAEAAATTDNFPTLAQPTVTVYTARGFLPYSIEIGMDYPDFANEMSYLLAQGYSELLVDKFTRGAGTTEPNGILTQLSANTNVRVTLTTVAVLGAPDPYKVWQQVPQRFRNQPNTAWLMSVATNNGIRQLGTANVYHAFTESLPANWADQLFGKRVYESPYMPDTTTSTTAPIGIAVVGDFSNYVIARNGGMNVELVPNLFDVTNNRPTGQRGWFAWARIGGNSVNDLGFRLLVNS